MAASVGPCRRSVPPSQARAAIGRERDHAATPLWRAAVKRGCAAAHGKQTAMRRQSGWAARSGTLAERGRSAAPVPPAGLPTAPPTTVMLQAWAQTLSIAHFGTGFEGTVRWAPRLRYRAGDYTPATGCIRLSLPYFQRYGPSETRRILLHELCHWWLYRSGQHHRESTAAFQDLLRRVGAPAIAHPLPRPQSQRLS